MSIHTITISNFRDNLMTLIFEVSSKLSKMWLNLMAISTKFAEIETLVFSIKKRIPVTFK